VRSLVERRPFKGQVQHASRVSGKLVVDGVEISFLGWGEGREAWK